MKTFVVDLSINTPFNMSLQSLLNSLSEVFGSGKYGAKDQHETVELNNNEVKRRSRFLRMFTKEEVMKNDGKYGRPFYAVIDGYVVDTCDFVFTHPGGLKKLLLTNTSSAGSTGKSFGFSFASGPNKHLRHTNYVFTTAVDMFERGGGKEIEVVWPSMGKLMIIGKLGD